ncbi:glycosyltransferase family 2 protein [Acidobacteriota bacterium]
MSERDPEVTVIIPTYNREIFIERAIQSVLDQTFQNFEIIVVDDASTDNTEDKIERLQAKDARILFFRHEKNLGAPAARNTGIRNAKGYYLTFLDSDDQMLRHKLESDTNILNSHQELIICTTGYTFVSSQTGEVFKRANFQEQIIDQKAALRGNRVMTNDFTVVKDAALKINGFNESQPSRDDYDFWIRITSLGKGIQVPLYTINKYIMHDDQISHGVEKKLKGTKILFAKHRELFESDPLAHSIILGRIGLMHLLNLENEALGYYSKSFRVDPRFLKKIKFGFIIGFLKLFRRRGISILNKYYRMRHPNSYLLW